MEIKIKSLDCIKGAAQQFINNMGKGNVPAFYGKMGTGKTIFTKAICECLDAEDVVISPTFAIVNEYYSSKLQDSIYHFDFYHIKEFEEVYDIGYEDYSYSHRLCFLEWPELVEELLPRGAVKATTVEQEDGSRLVTFQHSTA